MNACYVKETRIILVIASTARALNKIITLDLSIFLVISLSNYGLFTSPSLNERSFFYKSKKEMTKKKKLNML